MQFYTFPSLLIRCRIGESSEFRSQRLKIGQLSSDLPIEFLAMIVVAGQCRMNLRERQMPIVLRIDFLGAQAVSDLIQGDFDYFHVGVVDPGDAAVVEPNMLHRDGAHNQVSPRRYYNQSRYRK